MTEVSPRVQEALAVLAAGGLDPDRLGEGVRKVRQLMTDMHEHRLKRLVQAGFTEAQADEMSRAAHAELHVTARAGEVPAELLFTTRQGRRIAIVLD